MRDVTPKYMEHLDPAPGITVVHNIVLDILQPFIERIEVIEEHVNAVGLAMDVLSVHVTAAPQSHEQDTTQGITPASGSTALDSRVEAVLALHRLDASPAQWEMDSTGKRTPAPDGLWELSCAGCNYTTMWMTGDRDPKRCKTVELLTR